MKQTNTPTDYQAYTRADAREDLHAALGHHFSQYVREELRGLKPIKLPIVTATAVGTTTQIPANQGPEPISCGPEQGYFWRVVRITVTSNGVDTGAVSLYASSDPTGFQQAFLVDNTLKIGAAYYPSRGGLFLRPGEQLYVSAATVSGNTYRICGEAVEAPAEMVGKLV